MGVTDRPPVAHTAGEDDPVVAKLRERCDEAARLQMAATAQIVIKLVEAQWILELLDGAKARVHLLTDQVETCKTLIAALDKKIASAPDMARRVEELEAALRKVLDHDCDCVPGGCWSQEHEIIRRVLGGKQ